MTEIFIVVKLAYRNLLRNKRRSLIIQLSIIIGIVSIISLDSLMNGMLNQMLFNQISTNVSHVQIHKKGFRNNKLVQNYIPDYHVVDSIVKSNPEVKEYSKRVVAFGLVSSAENSAGANINGVIPGDEAKVSIIKSSIKKGAYLTGSSREIIISEKMAEKLNAGVGDKIVIMTTTIKGNVGSDLFRITGLFKTFNSEFDKTNIYISIHDAQQILNIGNNVYEFAIISGNYENADELALSLSQKLNGDYEVMSYKDILPLLIIQLDLYKQLSFFITIIISIALIFGIINTMLMAVFERVREFGVLMSIGMKNSKIFFMIIAESLILGLSSTIIGTMLGLVVQWPLVNSGLNLGIFSKSLDSFGIGAIIYPTISPENTIITFLTIPAVAVIGALYPAYKAICLQPVSALHYL